jgi:hypothetical protein
MGESDESLGFSESIEKRLEQHNRTAARFDFWLGVVWAVGLFLTIIAIFTQGIAAVRLTTIFLIAALVVAGAAAALTVISRWFLSSSFSRLARLAKTEGVLNALQREHPELVALTIALELVTQEKEEASSRRGFWASAAQNFFFLVLGILITYALTRLGWLR